MKSSLIGPENSDGKLDGDGLHRAPALMFLIRIFVFDLTTLQNVLQRKRGVYEH